MAKALTLISDNTKVIPGHGDLANKQDLIRFKQMLDETITWAQALKSQGKSLEQMKAIGLPAQWQGWGWRFISQDKWIETLYRGL